MRILLVTLVVLAVFFGQALSLRSYEIDELSLDDAELEPTNFLMIDTNHDGEADLKLSDSTGEGIYDTIQHLNAQPTFQKAKNKLVDVDQDGLADYRLVDSNQDGLYDQVNLIQQTPSGSNSTGSSNSTTVDPSTGSTTTGNITVVPLNPNDTIPTDGTVLKQPIIFPPPRRHHSRSGGVTFGPTPPANLSKPVIIDGTIPIPHPKKHHRCGCRNETKKHKSYRNDVAYKIKERKRKHRPCPCKPGRKNSTRKAKLPPIVAQLKPRQRRLRKNHKNCTSTKHKHNKRKPRVAPEYKLRRRERRRVLQPNCTAPAKKNHTIRPEFKRLTRKQRKQKNVAYAHF